ncbi:MAG: hypothetical protein CMP20_10455 [Rickettsiales bacterium]|nr:hypothetical protein [Rickettsiales bacterium]
MGGKSTLSPTSIPEEASQFVHFGGESMLVASKESSVPDPCIFWPFLRLVLISFTAKLKLGKKDTWKATPVLPNDCVFFA